MGNIPEGKVDKTANLDNKKGPLAEKSETAERNATPKEQVEPSLGDTRGLNVPDNKGGVKEAPSY